MAFALVACLGALQLAQAHSEDLEHRRVRYAVAALLLAGAFLGYYALAPELLTPGPAGGELMFLFGGSALLAVTATRTLARWPSHSAQRAPAARQRTGRERSEESLPHMPETLRHSAVQGDAPPPLKFEIFYLILGLSLPVFLFDVPLFHFLNGLALRTPFIDVPVQFLMNDYVVPTALVSALLALWFAGRDTGERAAFQRAVLRALLALTLASVTLKLINEVYFRPRPFTFDDSVRLLFYHPSDSSMPSNAATVCFVLAVSVWLRQRRWGAAMLVLAVGMTVTRVVGGVHYPADIVTGAWLGGLAAWLVHRATWLDRPLDAAVSLVRRVRLA